MIDSGICAFKKMTKTIIVDLVEGRRLAAINVAPASHEEMAPTNDNMPAAAATIDFTLPYLGVST